MFSEAYDDNYLEYCHPSVCEGDLGEKWCNFRWHIYDPQLYPNDRLRSPVFTTRLLSNTFWYLEVELSSPGNLRTTTISLNCAGMNNQTNLTLDVIYEITCNEEINISDTKVIEFHYDDDFQSNTNEPRNGRGTFSAPFHKLKSYLIVKCKLRPNKSMIRYVYHGYVDDTLPIDLRSLLLTSELSDTIVCVGDYRFRAHIVILHARLPKLLEKCLVSSKMGGKNIIIIKDLPVSVVKEMLKYAYTGQAYVDLESVKIGKDLLMSYSQRFWKNCCWEDHPFAETSFNYETDTISWDLKDVYKKSNLGSQNVDLLRHVRSKFRFSLNVDGSDKYQKCLMLTFEFLNEEMPKPTIISCRVFANNKESNKTTVLGETETLLLSNKIKRELKLCSFQNREGTFSRTDNPFILQIDLKFCYGSYKSSIKNVYDAQFRTGRCTSCPQLKADMEALLYTRRYWDIIMENEDGYRFYVHKAILLARWSERNKRELIKSGVIKTKEKTENIRKLLLKLYKGTEM